METVMIDLVLKLPRRAVLLTEGGFEVRPVVVPGEVMERLKASRGPWEVKLEGPLLSSAIPLPEAEREALFDRYGEEMYASIEGGTLVLVSAIPLPGWAGEAKMNAGWSLGSQRLYWEVVREREELMKAVREGRRPWRIVVRAIAYRKAWNTGPVLEVGPDGVRRREGRTVWSRYVYGIAGEVVRRGPGSSG